jgi:hypothetical protein
MKIRLLDVSSDSNTTITPTAEMATPQYFGVIEIPLNCVSAASGSIRQGRKDENFVVGDAKP